VRTKAFGGPVLPCLRTPPQQPSYQRASGQPVLRSWGMSSWSDTVMVVVVEVVVVVVVVEAVVVEAAAASNDLFFLFFCCFFCAYVFIFFKEVDRDNDTQPF